MNTPDLAVIIVSWNVQELVQDALQTLYDDLHTSGLNAQVIVVDSASSDQTVQVIRENFPQTRLIASETNLGFAGGNNAAMQALGFDDPHTPPDALPRAVYLLNPDTLTQPGATRTLYEALFAAPDRGITGARLTYGDGSFQHSAFMFPGLRQLWVEFFPVPGRFIEGTFNGRYPRELYQGQQPFEVDFMLGATMMIRRDVIQQTGMFDPAFFMYGEEVDWQWRIRKAGWTICCVPDAHVVHLAGKSTSQVKARSLLHLWQSRLRLFQKHFPAWKETLARRLVAAGMERTIRRKINTDTPQDVLNAYAKIREMMLS